MTVHTYSLTAPRQTRRGVTAVQFAFFLVLAALVTGASISAFATVRQSTRQSMALSLLTRTYLAVQDIGGLSRNYVGKTDLIPLLDGSNKIPVEARRLVGNGTVEMKSPFNTPITVFGTGGLFTITFEGYAKDDCQALLKHFSNVTAGQAGLKSLTVGSGSPVIMPATVTVLNTACDAANNVNIAFEYF